MKPTVICLLALSCLMVQHAQAVVDSTGVPIDLQKCLGLFKAKADLRKHVASTFPAFCLALHNWINQAEINLSRNVSIPVRNFVNAYASQAAPPKNTGRRKRQAGIPPGGPLRKRKEIRMMTDRERELFFEAVNALRMDTTSEESQPNKYEAIAQYHTGITSVSAHGGCNFHGWHRIYLSTFENALRDQDPRFRNIAIPYWDNTLEMRMDDPTQSALFSSRLLGSCEGVAKGGIMGPNGWNTTLSGEIIRNCGTDGPLITDQNIKDITSQTRMSQICGLDSMIEHDLEFAHNGGHRFIDGHMASLATAVFDPIFWLHHAFVDLIWELFRENQVANGVDPTTDYPENPVVMGAADWHAADADIGLGQMKVIDGLSDSFTKEIFQYEPRPTCKVGDRDCGGSKYIKCVALNATDAHCVARTLEEVIQWEEDNKPKPTPCPTPATPPTPVTKPTPVDPTNPDTPPSKPPNIGVIKPYQNNFCMNGKFDSSKWVFIPTKVIFRRPPEYKDYGSYPVTDGRVQKTNDIYAPRAYDNIYRYLRPTTAQPASFDHCLAPTQPTNEIYIKSTGINYEGTYKEFAIVDRRLAVTVATAYVAVKNPINGQSIAMLSAQDACGRVCKPICKVGTTNIFRPCSGAIRVTTAFPRQFGNTFGEAVLDVWDFRTDDSCPQLQTENIVISFYCDYKTDWIWPSVDPAPVTKPDPTPPPTVAGCSLGVGCTVQTPCKTLMNCQDGQLLDCMGSCFLYARCQLGQWYVITCSRGQKVDVNAGGCVRGFCDYSQGMGKIRGRGRGRGGG